MQAAVKGVGCGLISTMGMRLFFASNGNEAAGCTKDDVPMERKISALRLAVTAVCSPTRGSCLTGRHPSRYGITTVNAGHLRSPEICLAEVLEAKGYATVHFGKHVSDLRKVQPCAGG